MRSCSGTASSVLLRSSACCEPITCRFVCQNWQHSENVKKALPCYRLASSNLLLQRAPGHL